MTAAVRERAGALVERWMRRRSRETSGPVTLRYRRIYILPTRNGWLFAVLLLAMWLGAINYSNSMIFILVFLLASMSIVSILHTFRNLVNLRVSPGRNPPVFAGQTAVFRLHLDNPGPMPRRAVGARLDREPQSFVDVAPGGGAEMQLRRAAPRRGRVQLGRVDLFTVYPLGLFNAWSPIWLRADCIVYPAPEPGTVPPPAAGDGHGAGTLRGEGDEDFAGLRRYRPGDPIRHIAWKSGHARELQTKQFSAQRSTRLWLDYATLQALPPEQRLSRLCRWVLDAEGESKAFGLRLPGVEIEPATGPAHTRRCLQALALFPA